METLAALKPAFEKPYGKVTPGNASHITDGASWTLLASEAALEAHGLTPLARIVDSEWSALEPSIMGLGPVLCATEVLSRHGLGCGDVGLWEINEALAAQVLACQAAWQNEEFCRDVLGLDGAFGRIDHAVGTSGNRIKLHLVKAVQRLGARRGVATECTGGGQGGAMCLEAV